ncbi:unnamed protein product, partial [Didymodactylos carnosus]
MAVAYNNNLPIREDFRCALCRQKNVFHCEHDTKYRDQILGTYDPSIPSSTQSDQLASHRALERQRHTRNNSSKNNGRFKKLPPIASTSRTTVEKDFENKR